MSSEGANSLEFVSSKYDDLVAFKHLAIKKSKQINELTANLDVTGNISADMT